MLTKAVKSFCNSTTLSAGVETKCLNFTVIPTRFCYPVFYGEWKRIFQDEHKNYIFSILNNTKAYFLHVWNKMQEFDKTVFKLKFDSRSAYMHLARTHCPKVYKSLEKYF